MYTPPDFSVDHLPTLHAFVQQHSFATVVSTASEDADRLEASHLPLLLDTNVGNPGQLVGHMARANSQWKAAADNPVLAIFHGPHAYISPTWYAEQNVVPTWNYTAVHVHGTLRLETNPERLRQILLDYVATYEASMQPPWSLDSVPADFIEQLTAAIVGFTIDIERIEGKWKLSQNQGKQKRLDVIAGLLQRQQPGDIEVAKLMQASLKSSSG